MRNFLRATLQRIFANGVQTTPEPTVKPAGSPESSDSVVETAPAMAIEAPLKLTVWMIERDSFGVRGRALCTDVEVYASEAVVLCEGVDGYVLNTPNGETVVIEARSGGLVGLTLETVLDSVRDMPSSELIKQIDTGKKEFDRMKQLLLSNAEFWVALGMVDAEAEVESGSEY